MESRVPAEAAAFAAAAAAAAAADAARRMDRVVVPMEVEAPAVRHPRPRPTPPPSRVQRLVEALRGRFSWCVDTVLYGFVAAVWVALVAGNTPMAASRRAGAHSPTVAEDGGAVSWVSVSAMAPRPRPRPTPPPSRVQRLVAALRCRFSWCVDAVLYGFVAAVSAAIVLGNIPMAASRWAGANRPTVAVVGLAVSWVSVCAMAVLAPPFVPLFVLRGMDRVRAHDEPENLNLAGINHERNGAQCQLARYASSITKVLCILFCVVILTGILIKQLAAVKRSGLWAAGSSLVDIGFFACSVLSSLIILPKLVLKMRRMGVL